jgi:hypothetical protein
MNGNKNMFRQYIEIMFQKIPIKRNRFKKDSKRDYRSVRKSARNSKKYLQNRMFAV